MKSRKQRTKQKWLRSMAQLRTLQWTERVISLCTNERLLYCCGTQTQLSLLISHLPSYNPLQLTCASILCAFCITQLSMLSKLKQKFSKCPYCQIYCLVTAWCHSNLQDLLALLSFAVRHVPSILADGLLKENSSFWAAASDEMIDRCRSVLGIRMAGFESPPFGK